MRDTLEIKEEDIKLKESEVIWMFKETRKIMQLFEAVGYRKT